MKKSQLYFIYGPDTYRSSRMLKTIRSRFLAKSDSITDLVTFDMEETSLETLKQTLLTVPFLMSHRLFIIKRLFNAPKSTQEEVSALLSCVAESTVVVVYQLGNCDKRLALYHWLMKHATIHEFSSPTGVELRRLINTLALEHGVSVASDANDLLAHYFGQSTEQLSFEIAKVACYVLSQQKQIIEIIDAEAMCTSPNEESLFALADSLDEPKLNQAVLLYRDLITHHDPMLLAATLGSYLRNLTKIWLCLDQGVITPAHIVTRTKLNPYVVKLSLPKAKRVTLKTLRHNYERLVWFDKSVKDGRVVAELGVLLLILGLHGNLKKMI